MKHQTRHSVAAAAACLLAAGFSPSLLAQEAQDQSLSPDWVGAMDWRSIGPANMSGRIVDIEVYEADPSTFYAATASGGILKTINNGITFEHQFDREGSVSIGDMALSQSDPELIWVGTGEHNPRNSVSWGDGVYKSTDGGESWTRVGEDYGLNETFQIGKILIHPEDNDTVFVGAMGRLWGPNEERGLYRTADGGETWEKILYIDENTGIIDMAFHPNDPDVMLVAAWERARDEFDTNDPAKRWGPGSGLYRTTDGGESWDRVEGGLPNAELGRLSIRFSGTDSDTVYMLVDTEMIGKGVENPGYLGVTGRDAEVGATITSITADSPAEEAGIKPDDIVIGVNGERVVRYADFLGQLRKRQAGTEIALEIVRDGAVLDLDVTLAEHPDPEEAPFRTRLDGQSPDIQDQQGENGVQTGGLFRSEDGGVTWERINSINPRPMYFSKVYADPSDDNYMWVAGVPLYKSEDNGKTWSSDGTPGIVHVDHHSMWIDPNDGEHLLLGNDGGIYVSYDRGETWDHLQHAAIGQFYHVNVDNRPLYNVYGGLQDNGTWGGPNRTRNFEGTYNTDWFRVGGGDGFLVEIDRDDPDLIYYSSQNGGLGRVHLRTGDREGLRPREPRGVEYRWNWRTPFLLSHHNTKMYYTAGNHVFRSYDRGEDMKQISPEISRTRRGAATALDESPLEPDYLMVGTDDGALWVTRDGGVAWENLLFPYDPDAYPEEDAEAEDADADAAEEGAPRRGDRARGAEIDADADAPRAEDGGARLAAMVRRIDTNRDGKVQRSEFPERMAPFFSLLDTDGNGTLDRGELVAAGEMQGVSDRRPGAAREAPERPRVSPEERRRRAREAREEGQRRSPASDERSSEAARPAEDRDIIAGVWVGELTGQAAGTPFAIVVERLEDESLKLTVEVASIEETVEPVTFDESTGEMSFSFRTQGGRATVEAELVDAILSGTIEFDSGFGAGFEARREGAKAPKPSGPPIAELIDAPRRVSGIEWSKFAKDRVYLTLDGHYTDDDRPHVYVSEDAGRSWVSLRANLPEGTTRVIREDLENENVLYLGTEFALWVSVDRGGSWTKLNSDLPTVAIHEIAQHETSGEIVVATHGRSIWILDVTPIRQMTEQSLAADAWLYQPNTVVRWRIEGSRGRGANRWYSGENPPFGAQIFYSLKEEAEDLELLVYDAAGRVIRDLEPSETGAGMHRVEWDLRRAAPRGNGGRFRRGPLVDPGTYRVVMRAGDIEIGRDIRVVTDPEAPGVIFAEDEFLEELYEEEESGPKVDFSDRDN